MMRFLKGTFIVPGIVAMGAFWLIAPWFDISRVYAVVNGLALGISLGIVFTYLGAFWESLTVHRSNLTGGHILVLGLVLAWLSSGERGAFSYVFQWLGQPEYMRNTLMQAFAVWVLFIGGLLHLTARDAINGRLPPAGLIKLGCVIAGGCALALMALLFVAPIETPVFRDPEPRMGGQGSPVQ